MKKGTGFLAASAALLALSACNINDFVDLSNRGDTGATLNQEVVRGLRTALDVGIDSSSALASKAGGYLEHKVIKILLPEEAAQALQAAEAVGKYVQPFATQLSDLQAVANVTPGLNSNSLASNLSSSNNLLTDIAGLSSISDSVVKYMNRAAEIAAPRSGPIFKDAITSMSITDGLALLNSADSTAATTYLNGKTFNPLVVAYAPLVDSTLSLVPLTKYWSLFRTTYNSVLANYNTLLGFQQSWNANPVVAGFSSLQINQLQPINYKPIATESLGAWTTDKALGGLFFLVGEEEKKIRRDPFAYIRNLASDVADLLGDVFGKIMKMETQPTQ